MAKMESESARYLVFVDESGDHGLKPIDKDYPVLVLVFCIFRASDYARKVLPEIFDFKFRHFGHDQVILHEREIRFDSGEFAILRDPGLKEKFLGELTELIDRTPFSAVATVIHKQRLADTSSSPRNPYEIALEHGLQRVQIRLLELGADTANTPVIVECRGKREDRELELQFRRICDGHNHQQVRLDFEPRFVPKSANAAGLQIADLIARHIGHHVLDPSKPNRAWTVIERKLFRDVGPHQRSSRLKVIPF